MSVRSSRKGVTSSGFNRWSARRVIVAALVGCGFLGGAAPAQADFGIEPGSFIADSWNPDFGVPETQAGAHPIEAITAFRFNLKPNPLDPARPTPDGSIRDIVVDLPHGFLGNPEAAPRCSRAAFASIVSSSAGTAACPTASQVGMATIATRGDAGFVEDEYPIYNIETAPNRIADFGIPVATVPAHMIAEVDSAGTYRLRVAATRISQGLPIAEIRITLWGVPASSRYDNRRACDGRGYVTTGVICSVSVPEKAFVTNPTNCSGGPATTNIAVASWQNPGVWERDSYTTRSAPTGCDQLRFAPSISVRSDSSRAGVPAGYTVDIDIPQSDNPGALGTPPLRDAVVTMPAGTVISPPSADGLLGCDDSEFGYRSLSEVTCPLASKVATAEVTTPLLPRKMTGEVFLGRPLPNDMVRLFMVLRYPGLEFKIPGSVARNPNNGTLTATFDDNPPFPFSNLHLEFKGGPRAPLVNPSTCGPATATGLFTAWGVDSPVRATSTINITQAPDGRPCRPESFAPSFLAGLMNPSAGASSTFTMTLARSDEDQKLRDITLDMPEGLTGVIASADLCAEAQANAGTCGPRSQIGTTLTGAGQGPNPFFLPGRVYITGPYKGGPFGMSIVVPAVAGPFDLGTVVVRAAIHVDRRTAQLRVVSDPFPTILQGFPLQIRKVGIKIDKPGFMLAPTNCSRKSIVAQISSVAAAVVGRSSRFQVGNCRSLSYRPKLSLRIGDRKHTRAESTAPMQAVLTMPRGAQANNDVVRVTLPKNVNSRLAALRGACSVEEARARRCGRDAIIGNAVAVTPLLRDPLRGPVYIVRTVGNRLPDLWVALRGQIEFDLIAKVRVTRSLQLETTFNVIPDVPVSKFRLNFIAGRNAAIGLVRGICSKRVQRGMIAALSLRGQNNELVRRNQRMKIAGCGRVSSGRRATGRRGSRRGSSRRARRATSRKH